MLLPRRRFLCHSANSFRDKSATAKSEPNLFQILRIDNHHARIASAEFFVRI
jgi:hypothetical protein